jgi:Bacterial surface proteins containing Ig-like domains
MKKITFFCFLSLILMCSCAKEDYSEEKQITQITPSQSTAMLYMGDSLTLTLSSTPANLSVPICTWTSSNPSVATVDNNGKIKARGKGTTTINISLPDIRNYGWGLTTQCKVTVTYKGDGSASNPYLIYTVDDLKAIRDSINANNGFYGNKAYKLMNDLDFSKETSNWTPIGNTATVTFKGSFDGNGKTISSMHIGNISQVNGSGRTCAMQYAGLFGVIESATIKNIEVDWIQIMASFKDNEICYAGGIAGYGSGTIFNCITNGDFACIAYTPTNYVGGIIGYGTATTTIDNCHYNSGFISHSSYNLAIGYNAGGIAGYNIGTISNCSSSGRIGASNNYNGGIAGYSIGIVVNCFSSSFVACTSSTSSGGIAGYSVGTIINCYSTGKINGTYTGGIAAQGGDITNCYASGDIYGFGDSSASGYAGGIASTSFNVNNCIALNGKIAGVSYNAYAARICCLFLASGMSKNNYASPSMVVKRNDRTDITVTDFSDTKLHGFDLTAQPVDLLNAYVSANPVFNNIGLKKWKVTAGVNNGYPVFE